MLKSLGWFAFAFALVIIACTPAQRATVRELTPAIEKTSCVLLRAFTVSGTVDEVCATADELAPFVPELLAVHKEEPVTTTSAALVAFKMPTPSKRAPPRRRCASWILLDAGTVEVGAP